ncbi:MAG: hypothetical protein M3P52_07980, partial [Actinomycetota bacterium]|nr:hypothetical protein [Actinomycetota bacterium]
VVVGAAVVVGASVVVGAAVVVGAWVVAGSVAGLVTASSAVAAGSPDSVITVGIVSAEADEPFCEHEASISANAGTSSVKGWDAARRFIAT